MKTHARILPKFSEYLAIMMKSMSAGAGSDWESRRLVRVEPATVRNLAMLSRAKHLVARWTTVVVLTARFFTFVQNGAFKWRTFILMTSPDT